MRKLQFIALLFAVSFLFSSCSKDAEENLPGTWNTSDGGTVTFNEDGTGFTVGSDFFTFDCGTLNGVLIGPYTEWDWMITEDGENLSLAFGDSSCTGSTEQPIKIRNKNKATVGREVLGLGEEIELTR